jgi:plastocyanin
MRSRILLAALLLALAGLGPAQAATFTVTITSSGFNPSSVTIGVGDTVTWTNTDTSSHQVDSKSAGFTSPLLKPGDKFSFVYKAAGRFGYNDQVVKRLKGTVTVKAPTTGPTVTQAASPPLVVYGLAVTLSGAVSTKGSGETVTVFAKPYGQTQFASVGSAVSSNNGNWSFVVKPRIQTTYEARWKPTGPMVTSSPAVANVRPQVGFRVKGARGRVVTFFTKVRGARPFAGKFLNLQRKNRLGRWVTLRKVTLGSTSAATFKSRLPRGRSTVRLFMPAAQAAPGYVAGISRALTLSR